MGSERVRRPHEVEEAKMLEQWLRTKRNGKRVSILVPSRGNKKDLVKIALENAQETLAMLRAQWASDTNKQTEAINEIQAALGLPNPPNRIACFDISTIPGTATVASRRAFVRSSP